MNHFPADRRFGGTERDSSLNSANIARIYDYLLGGKDNLPADRAAAEQVLRRLPNARQAARENRAFLRRVVRYLAAEAGIDQFIDIGSGLPTVDNTHEIAQDVNPRARVVYVDNDPVVLAHGRALLETNKNTTVITADLRRPDELLTHLHLLRHIDWSRPVAVLLVAIVHFIPDEDRPCEVIAGLRSAMAPGSYLAISHGTRTTSTEAAAQVYSNAGLNGVPRTPTQIARFFGDWEPVPPGLVPITMWRPIPDVPQPPDLPIWGGVARKPPCGEPHHVR